VKACPHCGGDLEAASFAEALKAARAALGRSQGDLGRALAWRLGGAPARWQGEVSRWERGGGMTKETAAAVAPILARELGDLPPPPVRHGRPRVRDGGPGAEPARVAALTARYGGARALGRVLAALDPSAGAEAWRKRLEALAAGRRPQGPSQVQGRAALLRAMARLEQPGPTVALGEPGRAGPLGQVTFPAAVAEPLGETGSAALHLGEPVTRPRHTRPPRKVSPATVAGLKRPRRGQE
jgi:transcriptional regulator with XRE-family HTH domain